MKTKIILIAFAAIALLSFTFISTSHESGKKATANQAAKSSQSGFALQDSNQF
jgi:hypothetical protein